MRTGGSARSLWVSAVAMGCLLAAGQALAGTLRGVVRSVDTKEQRIVVVDADGDDNPLRVAPTAQITLNGRPAKLADLQPGDRVVATFRDDAEGHATASAIAATRGKP